MPIQLGELKLYSLKELSKSLGITTFTLRTYIRQGKLRARKMGTKWLVTEDALREDFKETRESKKEDRISMCDHSNIEALLFYFSQATFSLHWSSIPYFHTHPRE